jgi:hypothetical protein
MFPRYTSLEPLEARIAPAGVVDILRSDSIDSISEGATGTTDFIFTVFLSEPSSTLVSVDFRTRAETATEGSDFMPQTGTLVFQPGETSKQVAVPIIGDGVTEPNEILSLELLHAQGTKIRTDESARLMIVNDDNPTLPTIRIEDASSTERDLSVIPGSIGQPEPAAMLFRIVLSEPQPGPVTVAYQITPGTAFPGKRLYPGRLWPRARRHAHDRGRRNFAILVPVVLGDFYTEVDETLFVDLSNPTGATLEDSHAVGTIVDNDGPAFYSIDNVTQVEGATPFTFTVTRTGNITKASTAYYAIPTDYVAKAGIDFLRSNGPIHFAPGQTTATVTIQVLGDLLPEPAETFPVLVSYQVNGQNWYSNGTGTILDDDGYVPPVISIGDAMHFEGDIYVEGEGLIQFPVTLDHAVNAPLTVVYRTVDGTAKGDSDFAGQSQDRYLYIPEGATSATIPVYLYPDSRPETNESFKVQLLRTENAVLGDTEATGFILDEDSLAPADFKILPGKMVATWTDHDGDRVTLRVNKRVLDREDFTFRELPDGGFVLAHLTLATSEFSSTNGWAVSLTARRHGGSGDGYADVGHLRVRGQADSIVVSGTVSDLEAGYGFGKIGVGVLRVGSLGRVEGVESSYRFSDQPSTLWGRVHLLEVQRDWVGVHLSCPTVSAGPGSTRSESAET